MLKRTTGRIDQWQAFPAAFLESPLWGSEPGNGAAVYEKYSGRYLMWHSLYLQLGVETGLVGLALLFALLVRLCRGAMLHRRLTDEVLPLIGVMGFALIGVSVSALDAVSGVYLGLGFVAGDATRHFRLRFARLSPEPSLTGGRIVSTSTSGD